MRTLYDIADEYKELLDLLQSTDADEQAIQDTIESTGLKDDFRNKIDGYLYVIDELEASSKRIRNEEKRLADRRQMQERNAKKMKGALTDTMELLGIQKEKTDRYTLWVQNHPPKLVVEDEEGIPEAYWVEQPKKLNRRLLLDDLKAESYPNFKGARVEQKKGVRFR